MTAKNAPKTAAKARKKSVAVDLPIPQSIDEAASQIAEIGRLRRNIEAHERALNERLTQIREECDAMVGPLRERLERLFEGLKLWCEVHRQTICEDGLKSRRLPTGTISWRLTPPRVELRKVAEVLAALQDAGLDQLIRVKREVDKDAILSHPALVRDIPGISITQREEFIVEPHEDALPVPSTKAVVAREEVGA